MKRVILLNNGGFVGMDLVSFPVEVLVHSENKNAVSVATSELKRIGCDMYHFEGYDEWWFMREDLGLEKTA